VLLLLQSGDGTVSPVRQGLANVPSFMRRPFHLAWKGLRPGTFQVVKTTQSRGRTERTLLNALSQLRWHDEGCEVWFSLGENHEKVCRFGLHPLRNCIHAVILLSAGAPSRGAGMLRIGVNRSLRWHIMVCYTQVNQAGER
jgi:hypothetical protein